METIGGRRQRGRRGVLCVVGTRVRAVRVGGVVLGRVGLGAGGMRLLLLLVMVGRKVMMVMVMVVVVVLMLGGLLRQVMMSTGG